MHPAPSRRAARLLSLCALAAAAQAALAPGVAQAIDVQWVGSAGDWQSSINWSPSVPAAGDNVFLNPPNAFYSINYIPSAQPPAAYIPPLLGNIVLESTGGPGNQMGLNLTSGYRLDAASMAIGRGGTGILFQNNGALNITGSINLASQAGGRGTYTLMGGAMTANGMNVGLVGTGDFKQTGGQATITGTTVVSTLGVGTLEISGGTFTTQGLRIANNNDVSGQVTHTGGAVTVNSQLAMAPSPRSSASYLLSGTAVLSTASTSVGANGSAMFQHTGGTHQANFGLFLAQFPGSSATYALSGGLLSTSTVVLNANSTLHHTGGTLRTGQIQQAFGVYEWVAGTLEFTDSVSVPSATALGGRSTLGSDHTLIVNQTIDLQTPLTIDGGSFSAGTMAATGAGALHFHRGNLTVNTGHAALGSGQPLGQTLSIPSGSRANFVTGLTVTLDSILSVTGGRLDGGSLHNDGLIEVASPTSRMVSASLLNNHYGRLVSAGDVTADLLVNSGEIALTGSTAALRAIEFNNAGLLHGRGTIFSTFSNSIGEIQVEVGDRLRFLPSSKLANVDDPATNSGRISLLGGSLQFTSPTLINEPGGIIAGRGTLTANLVENRGRIHLSAGLSDIFAPLSNTGEGAVIVTGDAVATFHGPVAIEKETTFQVSTGSTAVFLAPVTNAGSITGGGAKHFEAGETQLGLLSTSGSSIVEPTGSILATHIRETSLTVSGRAGISLNGTSTGTSQLGSLTIRPGGQFDLSNNDLIIDDGDLGEITGYLSSSQLTSSSASAITTLGVLVNGARFATFSGLPVDASDVLVKYTYFGDANFDGRVTIADYLTLDRGFARGSAGWHNGDFNHSGTIDAADFFLIDSAFLGQGNSLTSLAPMHDAPAAPVPEPTILMPLLALGALIRRRPSPPLRPFRSARLRGSFGLFGGRS